MATTPRSAGRTSICACSLWRVVDYVTATPSNFSKRWWRDYARRTPMSALEAVLRRDRAIVITALAIITALAWADLVWLANDMWMGGMDMTGFRMIPDVTGWCMHVTDVWETFVLGAY